MAPTASGSQVRNLVSLLFAVAPEVADDPNLLKRAVVLTGLSRYTGPNDLLDMFALETDAAVLVRDHETGERAGLVVLADAGDCAIATNLRRELGGLYRSCVKARGGRSLVVAAADDNGRRRATTELLSTLIPPVFISEEPSIHLRCIFLRGADISRAVYGLCRFAEESLPAKGIVCAAVACEAHEMAVLVYDDADTTEDVAARASTTNLLLGSGVRMYDSSMFPVPAGAAVDVDGAAGMIPSFFRHPRYLGRVVLLRGLDTEQCDAREVAYHIHYSLEALIVHRRRGLVLAVVGSSQDARLLLQEPPDAWISHCGRPVSCELVDDDAALFQSISSAPARHAPYPGVHLIAIKLAGDLIDEDMKRCAPDDTEGIAWELIKSAALSRPDVLGRRSFPDRAALLLGVHPMMSRSHLWAAMNRHGEVDEVVVCPANSAALVVFKSWTAAAKLNWEPARSWMLTGFRDCRTVPGAQLAAEAVNTVGALLLELDARLRMEFSQMCDCGFSSDSEFCTCCC